VFNYINYGRMGVVHHLNPYTTIPLLEPQNDPAFTLSNWHWLVSPYGPLFTLLSYALVPLGVAGAFWTLKLVIGLASLGVLALVWRCAVMLRRDPVRAIALVGLNPIVLVWGLGADHNDILMVLPLTLGIYLLIRARSAAPELRLGATRWRIGHEYLAASAFVAASGIKASAAVVIPIAFAVAPRRRAFAAGIVITGGALLLVSYLAFGAHLPGLGSQTQLVTGIGPANLLGWIVGQGGETDTLRTILTLAAGGFVLAAAVRASRPGRDWIALAGASLFVVWITTSWFAPWYIVWILPFAALAVSRRLSLYLLLVGVYLLLAFGPEVTPLLHTLHFDPFGSRLGRQHSRLNSHLVQ
jgi:alpha-1,6-mannosyltransferase